MPALYRPGEVLWLLSITREEAIDHDASPGCGVGNLSGDTTSHTSSLEEDRPLLAIVRWWDVHTARLRVVSGQSRQDVLDARAAGLTEHATSQVTGLPVSTARRRFEQTLTLLVDELNGAHEDNAIPSCREMCMVCAQRPRCRTTTTATRPKGGWRYRQSSVCAKCLRPELADRLAA